MRTFGRNVRWSSEHFHSHVNLVCLIAEGDVLTWRNFCTRSHMKPAIPSEGTYSFPQIYRTAAAYKF
jgi:hypothetical protein